MALQKSVKVWVKGEMQYCENACSIARALVQGLRIGFVVIGLWFMVRCRLGLGKLIRLGQVTIADTADVHCKKVVNVNKLQKYFHIHFHIL